MPASLTNCSAPPGNSPPLPASSGNSVTSAGRVATAQCQNPDSVGASGSYTVTAKLRVSSGNPDQLNCGLTSSPPAPMIPLICLVASGCPLVIEFEFRLNNGSLGSASYGSRGRLMGESLSS